MRNSAALHTGTGEKGATPGPLATTFARLALDTGEAGLDLSARIGRPEGPGWTTAAGLSTDPDLLETLIGRIERGCGVNDRAYAGTSLLRSYLWRILTTSVATFLTERRLPDLGAENVALRFGDGGFAEGLAFASPRFFALPDDPEAGHPQAAVLLSEKDFLDRVREALATTHLPALTPALRALRVRRGKRALWGSGADVCAEAFMFVGQSLGREAEALGFAEELLCGSPLSGPTNFFVLEHDGEKRTSRVRNTCCLYYKLGNGPCLTCPRLTDEERRARLAAT
ncbi:MAG: hypothetical protein WA990_09580 [Rubrobacteraceae bacterium]